MQNEVLVTIDVLEPDLERRGLETRWVYRNQKGDVVKITEWKDFHVCVTADEICIKCGKDYKNAK